MNSNQDPSVEAVELAKLIKGMAEPLGNLLTQFQSAFPIGDEIQHGRWSIQRWCVDFFSNSLRRVKTLSENNFLVIESLGVLAAARYTFELNVWLRLIDGDPRYSLVYAKELMTTQKRYYEDTRVHLFREIALLKQFEEIDSRARATAIQKLQASDRSAYAGIIRDSMAGVEAEAARKFSLYLSEAASNGYGFQAHLVETKSLPQIEQALRDIRAEVLDFENQVPVELQQLVSGRWNWKTMATKVGLGDEYEYIYSFASKLLHATPVSISTRQQSLNPYEMCIFLRFVHVTIQDQLDTIQARITKRNFS